MIPFLKDLPSDQQIPLIKTFLSICNKKGSTRLKDVIPLLESLTLEESLTLLTIQDAAGTPLQDPAVFEKAIPFLKGLQQEQLKTVLSTPVHKIPLEDPEVFEKALPLLRNLSAEHLVDLLSIKNANGKTALHNGKVFEKAISFLEELYFQKKLQPEQLIAIFSLQDRNGFTLLDFEVFEKAIPFLEKLPVEQLLASLSIRNRDGDIPLIKRHVFEKAFPLMEKLLDKTEGFETLLLTPNKEGSIPLKAFILAVFSLKSPLPKEFLKVFECFLTILSKQVKESELYRFIYDSFESNFFNLLNALPSDQQVPLLATFLSISDKEGKTPLQSEDVLKNVVLLGQSLSIEQLLTILSIRR